MGLKNKKPKRVQKLSRKQQRKEQRKEKKVRRNDYFSKKKVEPVPLVPEKTETHNISKTKTINEKTNKTKTFKRDVEPDLSESRLENEAKKHSQIPTTEQLRKKAIKEKKTLETEMRKQRKKQLLEANRDEDKIISQMEKQLGLKKRKSKSYPKSFSEDGLDFLLEVVDPEYLKNVPQQNLEEADNDFEEDVALMLGKQATKSKKSSKKISKIDVTEESEEEEDGTSEKEEDDISEEDDTSEEEDRMDFEDEDEELEDERESESDGELENEEKSESNEELDDKRGSESDVEFSDEFDKESDIFDSGSDSDDNISKNIKQVNAKSKSKGKEESKPAKRKLEEPETRRKKQKVSSLSDLSDENENSEVGSDGDSENDSNFDETSGEEREIQKGAVKQFADGTWEDIYGRLRAKDGSVIVKNRKNSESKYIPPAMREKMEAKEPEDKKHLEKLSRLKRQLKGLLNRLAESNMHSITSQIEELYMKNSRNDMNNTLTNLIMDSLVADVLSPERLLIEHIVLLVVLHANVGTEVGAHFLQHVVRKFDEYLNSDTDVENKLLDNIVCIIAQLYNFSLFDSKLIYEVLKKLANNFKEKDVECILHILRSVGFSLRKDDPLALKSLIIDLQNRANNASEEEKDNARVKFMMNILLAIKNNNVTKIPNYDISYSEHLKKVMKSFIRKGNYVTMLNISLEDLLKADERGRWWVVGSAWTGNDLENNDSSKKTVKTETYSSKLLELAKTQRMNTDIRRNIFCIIMSAEDYMDAFEKLLKLGLKNTQEREIINIILHCCLQENNFNPYYGYLTQKFCDYDRKFQLAIKYSIWDKIKAMGDHSGPQLSNLAKLLIHLFIEKGLPLSTLKIVQFSELDKLTLRFMRQILLGILLHKDLESCLSVFSRVSHTDKLKLFRESIRLFIHHFLLRNLKTDKVPVDGKELIETRAKMVEKILASKEVKIT